MIKAAIAFIIFNRPRHTRESFEVIRAQRPSRLFIIADGPRVGNPTDESRCREVRAIVDNIDWPCEVSRLYADQNMGCKSRVSSGLDWVFSETDCAIVLEDDCVPHPDFFTYCDELLERYASDERVWVVTGNNFQDGRMRGEASYYFSKYNHCWGWATWSRAWKHYQVDIPFWTNWKSTADWRRKTPDKVERKVWSEFLDRVQAGRIDTWDYQWTACVWFYGGLTATPNKNLVTNIGFGPDATHTVTSDDQAGMGAEPLGPLTHPNQVQQDLSADRYVFDRNFGGREHPDRWRNRLSKRRNQASRLPWWLIKQLKQAFNVITNSK
jgi:hypothetical protein